MTSPDDIDTAVQAALKVPPTRGACMLEHLYRQSDKRGLQEPFRAAIVRTLSVPDPNLLMSFWGYRLGVLPLDEFAQAPVRIDSDALRLWRRALSLSVLLGLIWLVFSGGRPPVPSPDVASPLFWLGWAPATTLLIMIFIASESQTRGQFRIMTAAALILVVSASWSGWISRGIKGPIPLLIAIHLPILSWIVLGAAATLRGEERALQRMSFILKSAEALVASAIYFGGAGIFGILTLGIFNVLGIHFPESWINRGGAVTLGLLPVLAIASTYNPRLAPAGQDFSTGPARLMRLLCRLLLAPTLAVLVIYVFWFIPRYFWRAFEERSVLLVYNASLAGVLLLLVLAIPHVREELSVTWQNVLRHGVKTIGTLSLILNLYSLSAVVNRTMRLGMSANRHAILGWNMVTLCLLTSILAGQWRSDTSNWAQRFRESFARILPLLALWVAWVLLATPLFR